MNITSTMLTQRLLARPAALVTMTSLNFLDIVGQAEQMYGPWDIAMRTGFFNLALNDEELIHFLNMVASEVEATPTTDLGKPASLTYM
jgi:hypothetical protein